MDFEWSPAKATANRRKHRVSFGDAASVFGDPLAYTFADPDHSEGEERWLTLGTSESGLLLVVSHAEHDGRVRIISARRATAHERKIYEQG
jgi:uncharacterized DUF497 family protein